MVSSVCLLFEKEDRMYVNASFLFAPSPGLRPDKHFEPRRCDKTPKKPAHANPDPSHGRHELRGHWRVLRAQPRRPRAMHSGQVRRHDRQGNGEGARAAAERGHSTPEAPHTPAAGHRGKARLARKQNRAPALRGPQHRPEYARTLRHLQAPRTHGGEQRKSEHHRMPLGRREWAAHLGRGAQALWPLAASPRRRPPPAGGAWAAAGCGSGRAAGTPDASTRALRSPCCLLLVARGERSGRA
jgi:hypothetical protein